MTHIHKFLVAEHPIRAAIVTCPELIDELCVSLRSAPLATMAAGRSAIAAALLASQMKDYLVALRFGGDGPLGEVYAEANYDGRIRAHVRHAQTSNLFHNGELDVTAGIGSGNLEVICSHPSLSSPQVSTVALGGSGIGDDVAHYLHQSQQVLSVVVLGMNLNDAGRVEGAGGMIIELMQACPEDVVAQIEQNVANAGPLSRRLAEGIDAAGIAAIYLKGFKTIELEHPHPLEYKCLCSRDRVIRAFTLLGPSELSDIILEGRDRKVTCEFCHVEYLLTLSDIQDIAKDL